MDFVRALENAKNLRNIKGKPREALKLLQKFEHKAKEPHEELLLRIAMAHLYLDIGESQKSQKNFGLALSLLPVLRADILRKYAYLLWKLGKSRRLVLEALNESLRELGKESVDRVKWHTAANVWATFGNIWFDSKDCKKALEAYKKALEFSRLADYKEREATVLGDIGNVYWIQKRYKNAITALNQALRLARRYHRHAEPSALLRLGRVYAEIGKYPQAKRRFGESLKVAAAGKWKREIGDANNELGKLALRIGNNKNAARHFRAALKIYRELGFKPLIRKTEKAFNRFVRRSITP